jgi:1-acyl-sn-glycerol-3-phosphate acyltransferase
MLILRTTGVRVECLGAERLDPRRSYVLASNHQSIYDIPILFATLPLQLRIVAKESLGRIPFLGWHLRGTGHLLVDRRNPGADIVEKMRRLVSEAHSLIVFPEGTRSVDGRVGRFKKGSFLVAIDAALPVVPVSVSGSRHVMRKGRLRVCPGEVRVVVHEPIPTAGVSRDEVIAFAGGCERSCARPPTRRSRTGSMARRSRRCDNPGLAPGAQAPSCTSPPSSPPPAADVDSDPRRRSSS